MEEGTEGGRQIERELLEPLNSLLWIGFGDLGFLIV